VERKRLVLDANILIRGCLGLRVRALIARYADQVDFFVAEANVAEAAAYIAELARKRGLSAEVCDEALLSLLLIVQVMENSALGWALVSTRSFTEPLIGLRWQERWS
jgi:predicted nucleic acid-binding protein